MFILGGVQSDFARHLARENREVADLVGELVDGALADARVEAADIQSIHVGNAFGQLFTGQGHLGAMPATVRPSLWGVPATRYEAACASGSMAALGAMAQLAAGYCDVALVLGVEQERNVPGDQAARHLAAAAWVGHEGQTARYLWPSMFSALGDAYAERWGLRREHLVAIAKKNLANARKNPLAQTRAWSFDDAVLGAAGDDPRNPTVEGRLQRYDCAQVTDGGAAIVVASPRFATEWAQRRGLSLDKLARVAGWGHRTVGLPLDAKLARSGTLLFPHVADAVADARRRAGISRDAIDAYEVHDCFTTTEYMAIDHLGLTPPGESWRAVETPTTPINPSGGLIGGGHPVGATGIRMLLDASRQVTRTAGACQVDGARRVQTLNLGGSAATVASFVVAAS